MAIQDVPVGPSRHLVRFVEADGRLWALKELPVAIARREYEVLRELEDRELSAVRAAGVVVQPFEDTAVLVTHYLATSWQYRRLLMRVPITMRGPPVAVVRRHRRPSRRPPPPRLLLGRLLAGQHPLHARRPAHPRLAGRRRDGRVARDAEQRPAGPRPRHHDGEPPRRPARRRRPPGGARRGDRADGGRGRERAAPLRRAVAGAARGAGDRAGRAVPRRGAGPPSQRARLRRGRGAARDRGVGCRAGPALVLRRGPDVPLRPAAAG